MTHTHGACMGGFCEIRESCVRYHADNRAYPTERLCGERHELWKPLPHPAHPRTPERDSAQESKPSQP